MEKLSIIYLFFLVFTLSSKAHANAWAEAQNEFEQELNKGCPIVANPPPESGVLPFPCEGKDIHTNESFKGTIQVDKEVNGSKYITYCAKDFKGGECNFWKLHEPKSIKIKCPKNSGYLAWTCSVEGTSASFNCTMSKGTFNCGSFSIAQNDPRGDVISVELPQGGWGPVKKLDFRLAK